MSTSPTRYYASKPSSRPSSPPSSAQVRSQAIAKLKRAASLPRNGNGRRPTLNGNNGNGSPSAVDEMIAGPSTLTPTYPSLSSASPGPADVQEILSPSPVNDQFDHADIFVSPSAGMMMQRSASASSSYHMPTPPHLALFNSHQGGSNPGYFGAPANGHTDWAAMQLAQSYLPGLSPAGMPPSPFLQQPPSGRNTPSPLPTLGELRTLQRSNSNAARAHAMSKLTGGKEASSDEDHVLVPETARPNLQRADSLGAPRLVPVSQVRAAETPVPIDDEPVFHDLPRPRLQRSFTVSSSNMGEERRSAVGRRMMARLGERKAAKQQEDEVRKLWKERKAAAGESAAESESSLQDPDEELANEDLLPAVPVLARTSPPERPTSQFENTSYSQGDDLLAAPERAVSRGTMRSEGEAFEYDAHLRRSLSSRTARGAVGTVCEANSRPVDPPLPEPEELQDDRANNTQYPALGDPIQSYATPTRHAPHSSTSTQGTIQGSQSPGESVMSRDALGSMMFVMGRGSAAGASTGNQPPDANWPAEVEDHSGSDWGTPARDLHQPTFHDSPLGPSPLAVHGQVPHQPVPSVHPHTGQSSPEKLSSGDEITPPGTSRASVMSWEEVGGPEDQTVPSDEAYSKSHKKSGSMSAKIGRNIRTAMKRSQSRSSVSSSNEGISTSPKSLSTAIQNFSNRRGSASSLSPSQASTAKSGAKGSPYLLQGDNVKHQPSISSLSPSLPSQPESSANSMLLQHQLSSEQPSPMSWLPRADLNDPRIHSSKLSPFPGIAQLEKKGDGSLDTPKLIHQTSDSAVPSQQRVTPALAGAESIYSLPLQATSTESRRASDDSVGKRSWLSKAFASTTSPRSSGSVSRQNSTTDNMSRISSRKGSTDAHGASIPVMIDSDPFAGPPPPAKAVRHRSASPAVSVVPEDSEEGSRLTRFTAATNRLDNSSPPIEPQQEKGQHSLPSQSMDVLNRMDALLALGPDDPARPDILDDPPRKLLLATQILQVVNVNTAKDRFLFLFNDLLVITKPLIDHGVLATLDMKFLVKSVVALDKLKITGFEGEPTADPPRHAVVDNFIEQFAENPVAACKYLVERSNPRVDAVTLASLIFKTPELDRSQIGNLLAGNERLMRAFIDRYHFAGIRVDDALRMFLLSIRLPANPAAAESLLKGFANRYYEANHDSLGFARELAEDLVLWIMQLNDTFYGMYGFALPNHAHAMTPEVFISAFQSKDPRGLVSSDLLRGIYSSVKGSRLDQGLSTEQERSAGRTVTMNPQRIPAKLMYNTWSDPISLSLPHADPHFSIRLLGAGLEFEPAVLEFGSHRTAQFRVKGRSLGTKSILFDRGGPNAPLYASIGNTRTLTVERAFMRNTFQVAFTSHLGLKRKYCFSVSDAATRAKWAYHLSKQISIASSSRKFGLGIGGTDQEVVRSAAQVVSLQVLRDALIAPEPTDPLRGTRPGSVSIAYGEMAGRDEVDLGPLIPGKPAPSNEGHSGLVETQTGKELVLTCRQNSLLPGVLEVLQAGLPRGGGRATGEGSHVGMERMLSKRERGVGGRV